MDGIELPVTRYALSGDVSIANQVMGDGPVDIILIPGFMSHIEFQHELAGWTAFLRRLSKFARVVTFDKRGQGLSDRISDAPSLEQRMDDVRAIMDAVGSKRATLFGHSEGCAMSVLFAATYPERVSKLILCGGYGRRRDLPDKAGRRVRGVRAALSPEMIANMSVDAPVGRVHGSSSPRVRAARLDRRQSPPERRTG
jgi:pimeloyl-ACP methyl ester carboxylesterase